MIIGFTGSQSGRNPFQANEVMKCFDKFMPHTLHHGDCIGSDAETHYDFIRWHIKNNTQERTIIIHPPIDFKKRAMVTLTMFGQFRDDYNNCKFKINIKFREPFAYLERNRHIVDESEQIVATPKEVEHTLRSGTWATIRYAWKQKKTTIIIPPLFAESAGNVV